MASDGSPANSTVASLAQASQAAAVNVTPADGGKAVSSSGKTEPPTPAAAGGSAQPAIATRIPVAPTADPQALVQNLNKFLNDSGLPDQFRLDPSSGGKLIQQINPATGVVVGEFSAVEFPALARSVGVTGLLVDSVA